MERQRGHSIDAAIAGLDHAPTSGRSVHVNLIDTPGYPDSRGPTLSALAAVETVAIVVDADKGVEYGTRRMMTRVQQRGLCRGDVVNKIDHDAAACARVLGEPHDEFGPAVRPLNRPPTGGQAVAHDFDRDGGARAPGQGPRRSPH